MIYENIKKHCEEKKITITELERAVGLSNNAIGKWRTCAQSVENAKKVADYLGTTVDELILDKSK